MSNESASARPERSQRGPAARPSAVVDRLANSRERIVLAAGGVALAVVAIAAAIAVVRNLPYRPVAVPDIVRTAVVGGAPVVLALAAVATALTTRRTAVRVGLLFVGVFGLLAAVSESATLPAVAAGVGGGGLALLGGLGRPSTYRQGRRLAIAVAIVAGVSLSLAATAGILDASMRGLGGTLALAGVAGLGLRAEGDWVAVVAGVLAVAFVVYASATRPFAVGSGLLVGFAVVDVPHLLVALALGGGVAAGVAGVRRRAWGLAVGAGLLVLAGVPATVPRATAVVLGATLALVSLDRLVGEGSRGRATKEGPA